MCKCGHSSFVVVLPTRWTSQGCPQSVCPLPSTHCPSQVWNRCDCLSSRPFLDSHLRSRWPLYKQILLTGNCFPQEQHELTFFFSCAFLVATATSLYKTLASPCISLRDWKAVSNTLWERFSTFPNLPPSDYLTYEKELPNWKNHLKYPR